MTTRFVPNNKRVALTRKESTQKTAGGIIIPATAQQQQTIGTVVATDPNHASRFAVGDTVIFGKYSGTDLTIDGEELTVIPEDEILGAVKA